MDATTTTSHYPTPRKVSVDAPWKWLAAGWKDLLAQPVLSLSYGLFFVGMGYAISIGLWKAGLSAFIPVAAGAFTIVGPMVAMGLYELSRRREMSEPIDLPRVVFVKPASPLQLAYMGFLILFAMMVWARMAALLYAIFASSSYKPISEFSSYVLSSPSGLAMLIIGTIIGGVISLLIFSITAFSVPMLMHKKTDFFTATVSSVRTLFINPKAALLWAWIIAGGVIIGGATAFLGFVVIFPLLGHATWHAYRDVFPDPQN